MLASVVANQCRSIGLDAHGTDYYDDDLHMIPAINAAIRWLMSVASVAFHQKRMSEELFKNVIKLKVYQTNSLSRIKIGTEVYSILNVLPYPTCLPNNDAVTGGNAFDSIDLSIGNEAKQFVSCEYQCKRLTSEQWNFNKKNPFRAGNTVQSTTLSELSTFAYYSPLEYGTYGGGQVGSYIEISPAMDTKLCGVTFLETQDDVEALTDEINFDLNFLNILAFKTTSFLTLKQGDGTTIHKVSEDEVLTLLSALS
jgi:hypothetical protein